MKMEIKTEAPIFLFLEYLFPIFGILSLQCGMGVELKKNVRVQTLAGDMDADACEVQG